MNQTLNGLLAFLLTFAMVARAEGPAGAFEEEAPEPRKPATACAQDLDYKPIGFVTSGLLNRFTEQTPLLFTETYFRGLGNALHKQGFDQVVNSRGVYLESSDNVRTELLDALGGKSQDHVNLQGRIANDVWEYFVAAFKVDQEMSPDDLLKNSRKAYAKSADDYAATRDFFRSNLTYKRQIIELIRLSLPFGVKMAVRGLDRTETKSRIATGLAVGASAALSYGVAQTLLMVGTPDPGLTAIAAPLLIAPLAGAITYVSTAPKARLRRLNERLMNWRNRRELKKQGLVSPQGLESTALIEEEFRDLADLQNEVNLEHIQSVFPLPPSDTSDKQVETAMFSYGDKLGKYFASISAFHRAVAAELQDRTLKMGEPITSLARLLESKGGLKTAFALPENSRFAIEKYGEVVAQAFERLQEVESEYDALREKFEMHELVLTSYLERNQSALSDTGRRLVEQKLMDLRKSKPSVQTNLNLARLEKDGLRDEKRALDSALATAGLVDASRGLDDTQRDELKKAIGVIEERYNKANAGETAEVPVPENKP